ncbi:MAG: esterase/lipase family protein [Alphaproteobacteria bacterium]
MLTYTPAETITPVKGVEFAVSHVVTLVHGTTFRFLRPGWLQAGSLLFDVLLLRVPDLTIKTFRWSGSLLQSQRAKAAEALKYQLRKQLTDYPHAAHTVIAHSHGGNVALYALADQELATRIEKVICLNTPFINAQRRNAASITAGPFLIYIILSSLIAYPVLSRSGLPLREVNGLLLVAETLIFITLALSYLKLMINLDWVGRVRRRRENAIKTWIYPRIKTPVFCLWSVGDEVRDVLSFLDFTTNLPYPVLRLTPMFIIWLT